MHKHVIIVAGGRGSRLKSKLPKQFIEINNFPVLHYSLQAFHQYDSSINIVLVLPKNFVEYWESIIKEKNIDVPHKLVVGGETRYHSVLNGLSVINEPGYVAIHDGARPIVSYELIERGFMEVGKNKAVIPVIALQDSIRKLVNNGTNSKSVERAHYVAVQTPQFFDIDALKEAYSNIEYNEQITDDASVFEQWGGNIHLMEGEVDNFKVTTPRDLKILQALLSES